MNTCFVNSRVCGTISTTYPKLYIFTFPYFRVQNKYICCSQDGTWKLFGDNKRHEDARKGGSIHNIKKFCLRNNLKQKEVVANTQLEAAVVQAVQEVS